MRITICYLSFSVLCFLFLFSCKNSEKEKVYQQAIINSIDSIVHKDRFNNDIRSAELQKVLISFYSNRENKPVWIDSADGNKNLPQLLNFIRNSELDGLRPETYHLNELIGLFNLFKSSNTEKKVKKMLDPKLAAKLEVQASASYLLIASHLVYGRIEPADSTWKKQKRIFDLQNSLNQALNNKKVLLELQQLVPRTPEYILLKQQLKRFRLIQKNGGWKKILYNLNPDDRNNAIPVLRTRLELVDLLKPELNKKVNSLYDANVFEAVKKYQRFCGIPISGMVDDRTRKSMNIDVERRVAQLEINLERMRWLPGERANQAIVVNLPEYLLRVYRGAKEMMNMRVIIGDEVKATPIMRDTLQYLVFSPTWTVPKSIMVKEMLPQIKRRPNYFETHDLEVFTSYSRNAQAIDPSTINWQEIDAKNFKFRFVQRPGSENPLGLVKFMFPNKMSIYLHDSPGKYLFNSDKRTMSHGCVRIEKPFDLAMYVLSDQPKFDSTIVDSLMNLGIPKDVRINQKFEIRFTYYTAFVDNNGNLNFRPDIYHHDETQMAGVVKTSYSIGNSEKK